MRRHPITRRSFLAGTAAAVVSGRSLLLANDVGQRPALIAITLDLEMSRQYPQRDNFEWDFQKGNLDDATKQYAVDAARVAKENGGLIHFFCVGRVLEQKDVEWLKGIAAEGHPVGNHTYDHVNVTATDPASIQFRFQRAPWLVKGKTAREIIYENIQITTLAMQERAGIKAAGFRTPGGFNLGLEDRPDLQEMLLELGFEWVSSKYPAHKNTEPPAEPNDETYQSILETQALAQPFVYPSGLIEVPMSPISDVGAFRTGRWKLDWFLKAIRIGVENAISTGGVYDFLAHPSCLVVEDPQFESIKLICELVRGAGDRAKIVALDEIAARAKADAARADS